jgi:hypothetical protein
MIAIRTAWYGQRAGTAILYHTTHFIPPEKRTANRFSGEAAKDGSAISGLLAHRINYLPPMLCKRRS